MKWDCSRAEFARTSQLFQIACRLAGVRPCREQVAKWRRERGKAWAMRVQAEHTLRKIAADPLDSHGYLVAK